MPNGYWNRVLRVDLSSGRTWIESPGDAFYKGFHELGTGAALIGKHMQGHLIVRNFRDGQMETCQKIDAMAIRDNYRVAMDGCYACSVRCKKRVNVDTPWKVEPRYGGPEYETMGAPGTDLAMHDPRAMEGMRKNYPVNPTGGDHTGGAHHRTSVRNSAGVCTFLRYDEPRLVGIINGVTGWGVAEQELEEVSRRGLTMARLFNLREGKTRADDRLPWRLHQPIAKGPLSSYVLPREEVEQIVTDYYAAQGWDPQTGVPTEETIERLGLRAYVG